MRVVFDTNVVISRYLSPKGVPAVLLDKWEQQEFELLVSEAILEAYQKVLGYAHIKARHQMSEAEITQAVERFKKVGLLIEVVNFIELIKDDPDDNKFVECAVAGGAGYIVSGDAHLLNLREYQGISILSPTVFLSIFNEQ